MVSDEMLNNIENNTELLNGSREEIDTVLVSCIDPSLNKNNLDNNNISNKSNDLYILYLTLIEQGSISPFIGTLPIPESILKKGGGRLW